MGNSNGVITAPVSMRDLQVVLGTSINDLAEIILTARYGGSYNGRFAQAFWTREYNRQGSSALGILIDNTEPLFNLFSENSPVEWMQLGEDLQPRLKRVSYIPNYIGLTPITYSFNLQNFNGYNHNSMKCELINPADFISTSATKNIDIHYRIPYWFKNRLPQTYNNSFYVLSQNPPDVNGSIDFYSTVRIIDFRDDFYFQTQLQGLPQYKDQKITLNWYVSVWDWIGDGENPNLPPSLNPAHYVFKYKMPNIGKAYASSTHVVGGSDRPAETVNMDITLETRGSIGYGYYTRIASYTIEVRFIDIELAEPSVLICDDLGFELGEIEAMYFPVYTQIYNFPKENHTRFTIKPR